MTTFLLSLLPASLWIYAIHILFQKGHLFEKQGKWMKEEWPNKFPVKYREIVKKINKPLFSCEICMASTWGTLWFFVLLSLFFSIDLHIKLWVPYVFLLCGMNTIFNKLISHERIIVDDE